MIILIYTYLWQRSQDDIIVPRVRFKTLNMGQKPPSHTTGVQPLEIMLRSGIKNKKIPLSLSFYMDVKIQEQKRAATKIKVKKGFG